MTLPSSNRGGPSQKESFLDALIDVILSPVGFIAMGVGCGFAAVMFEEDAQFETTSGAACGFAIAAGLCAVAAAIVHVVRGRSN